MRTNVFKCVALMFVASGVATAQRDRAIVSAVSYTSVPARVKVDESVVRRLHVPDGFSISVFAQGLGSPRMLAVADDGTIYITRRDSGDVIAIRDDGNGRASAPFSVVRNLRGVHGIALHDGHMYLATVKEIFVGDMNKSGTVDNLRAIVTDLPDGGQHPNRTLAFGPDGMLYVSVGSTCNLCIEPNEENATMLRMKADGSERGVYARGLRNTIGWGWHPVTRELWGMDHGSDAMGDDRPPEELNKLQNAANYGWPFCYADQVPDSNFNYEPPGSTKKELCPRTTGSVLEYQAHSAPIQLAFYLGKQFPDEYRNDAFVAMRGSWNRRQPSGYKLVRIHFEDGKPRRFEDFVTGFISGDGDTHFGRLAGVAVARDGSILLGDDTNGMIYRIAYGTRAASASGPRTRVAAGELFLDTTTVAMPPRNATPLPPSPVVRANRVAFVDGLKEPESVIYDADQDVYFVSNVEGKAAGKDGRGFITRISAKDGDKTTRWINSGHQNAMFNAPKGMAIVGDTLWVADIDVMRSFNRKTGAPIAVVDFGTKGATYLNDVAIGGD
ncbi:MAG TPA: PQQ-dependent sugar dehydrogenase, partial [Gemmatimonadaceae bacterium]